MSKYLFILAEKANHSIKAMCRVLMVSTSAFYDWLAREPSERDREDELLATHIRAIHKASKGTYGSPRVHAELRRGGFDVSRKRVIRIMQRLGLRARRPRKWKTTTVSTPGATVAPNRLKRDFTAKAPNEVWTADITYMWTWEGWLYLAAIVDLFSRRVVGWAAADHMRVDLVLEAFGKAVLSRRPPAGLMFHSDRGSQFTSHRFRKALADQGMVASMSRRGDCFDNAVSESFFATYMNELIHLQSWPTRRAAIAATADFIDARYNTRRLHSTLGYRTPAETELEYRQQQLAAA